jgi:hypothetical protein
MKTASITIFLFVAMCTGCKKDEVKGFYNSMHFVREGGGQIEFTLFATDNSNELKAVVTRYLYRDTTFQVLIEVNNENSSAFSSLNKAMNNQIKLNGDYKESSLPTGTWAFIYLVNDNKQTKVTNTALRTSLLEFEGIVVDKFIKPKQLPV